MVEIIKKILPKASVSINRTNDSSIVNVDVKGGLFSSPKKLIITYRQRNTPSYQLPEVDDSPLTANLKGLYGFVSSLPARNEEIKNLFLQKILTLNSEFSVQQEKGEIKELRQLIKNFAEDFDAILFVQSGSTISKSTGQHFLDKDFRLIIDMEGNCEIKALNVAIDARYFDNNQAETTESQKKRKSESEDILELHHINVNRYLPCIAGENETILRTPTEIARRVSVLTMMNYVAFSNITAQDAINYLKKYNLWDFVTFGEKEFLANPTKEKKSYESWKCEGIWVFMWALKKVDTLEFPDKLCSLDDIPSGEYPVGADKDPNLFINSITESRTKEEILDANDLHYRLNWACVDARINGKEMDVVHPGVVYERHYALNWLINYRGQEWDEVSCDT